MPIQLSSSRRDFLAASAAGSMLALLNSHLQGQEQQPPREEHRFALLADTHIHAQMDKESRGANMGNNLRSVVEQLLKREQPVQASFILGDCAFGNGQVKDYETLRELLTPLIQKQGNVYLALGNHDDRTNVLTAFPAGEKDIYAKVERRVMVVPSSRANWFLLDSLDLVDKTPGKLGETQLAWLTEVLDAHADKPALIGLHHNVMLKPVGMGQVVGLLDSADFLKTIASRKHVKAVFYGHTHDWNVTEYEGLHLINLPPVAYVFKAGKPNGWGDCLLHEDRCELTLHCHDKDHTEHKKTYTFKYRV